MTGGRRDYIILVYLFIIIIILYIGAETGADARVVEPRRVYSTQGLRHRLGHARAAAGVYIYM